MNTSRCLKRDGVCLLPDGPEQALYDGSDGSEVPVPRLTESSPHAARIVDDYLRFGFDMHIHIRVGRIANNRHGSCAVLKDSSVDLEGTSGLQVDLYAAQLNARRVDDSVLVLVPAVVHKSECPMLNAAAMRIRLQFLDECLSTRADPSDQRTVPAKVGPLPEYREAGVRQPPSSPVNRELVHRVIQRRPDVMDSLTEGDAPLGRELPIDVQVENVLSATRIHLGLQTVGAGLCPVEGDDLPPDGFQVMLRAPDFGSYRGDSVPINLHPVATTPVTPSALPERRG